MPLGQLFINEKDAYEKIMIRNLNVLEEALK